MEASAGEVVLYAQDGLQLWNERRPGFSIFGSYVGRVLLTSARFVFLSTGDSGAARRMLVGGALGPIGALVFGQTPTDDLDERALASEGSLAIPLGRITDHGAQKRCDCATYVSVQYTNEGNEVRECSFMPKDSVAWSGAAVWAEHIEAARKAVAGSADR
jgi:hypothetical protein